MTALKNSAGQTVAYLANNPNAEYIVAGVGAAATAPRNTFATPRIDDIDFGVSKRFNLTETKAIQFGAQAFNLFNHPQYVPGSINTVYPRNQTTVREMAASTTGNGNVISQRDP